MVEKGNIVKISSGTFSETASKDYTAFANTIQSNAGQKIVENSKEGIVFGEPKEMKFTTVNTFDVLAGIFFDGTLNNKFNTASGSGTDQSYKNDTLTIDVFGFSRGAAAARNFIYEVTKPAYEPLTKQFSSGEFDAHGKKTTLKELPEWGELGRMLLKNSLKVHQLEIRFVGLFDTVSSFNKGGKSASPNFDNDVEELHLDQLYKAKKVIHFTAADEHREYFALTHIQSSGDKGIELAFPGVHSDVGGSYPDGAEHVDEIIKGFKSRLTAEKERLIIQGWYTDRELTVNSWTGTLSGDRILKKDYSYIPLHFMCEFGVKYATPLPFTQKRLEREFIISTDSKDTLGYIKKRLHDYVFDKAEPLIFKYYRELQADFKSKKISASEYNKQLEDQNKLRVLRNKY